MRHVRLVVGIVLLLAGPAAGQSSIVADVRAAIARNDLPAAEALVSAFRRDRGTTAEALEALSWLGRGALAAGDHEAATRYAEETRALTVRMLKTRPLDADKHLPVALGAAIETEAKVMAATGRRASAVIYLQQHRDVYRATSIRGRLQKNIHLLSLEGQPAPRLTATEHLGSPMPNLSGRPVLLFFWAHWCADCKAEAPIVADLQARYREQGLVVVGPTRRYGYVAGGREATPADELKYIDSVRQQYYGAIEGMPVPVSDEDALGYGMDATPTIVLVDRQGKVALYRPGRMTREELEPLVKAIVEARPSR